MSDSLSSQQPNIGSQIASYATFPAVMQGASGLTAIARHKGIKNAIAAQNHQGFKNLAGNINKDVFSKSAQIASEYETYKSLVKDNAKYTKKLAKIQKAKDISLWQKIKNKNPFRKAEEITKEKLIQTAQKNADDAARALSKADDALKSGKSVIKATGKGAAEAAATSFKTTAGSIIKTELKSKINIAFAGLFTFWPTFKNNAIPAFKNDGFKAGVKETVKALGFGAADLGASAVATAIGGTIGAAIGSFFCLGVGSNIGRTIGSGIASMFVSCKIADAAQKSGKYTSQETQNNNKLDMEM